MAKPLASTRRNEFLPMDLDPQEATAVVEGLLSSELSVGIGIRAGLRYLRAASKRFGSDSTIDILANLVVRACNNYIDDKLKNRIEQEECFEMSSVCKLITDGYREKAKAYGSSYRADRCRCLFNLAECLRERSRLADCIKLLKECEILLSSSEHLVDSPPDSNCPSIGTVCTCLAEALLLNGEAALAGKKARIAIRFFRLRSESLTRGQWVAYSQSFLLYCKSCFKLKKIEVVRDALNTALQQSEICPYPSLFEPIIHHIQRGLDKTPNLPSTARQSHSLSSSLKERIERGYEKSPSAPSTARSHRVTSSLIEKVEKGYQKASRRPESITSSQVQSDLPITARPTQESLDVTHKDLESGKRSQSVPPRIQPPDPPVVQYVQSRTALDDEWIACTSSSTGREYFYNKRTGLSKWAIPD